MSFFQPAGTAAVRGLTRRRERSGPCCLRQGPFFFAQRGVRARPAGPPTCAGLAAPHMPAALANMRRSCRARPAALANMRRFAAPARPRSPTCAGLPRPPGRARRHAPVLPRPPGRPADLRRFAAPARPARHNAPVSHTRPAAPRPPAGLCLSPWKAEKYAPAKYIYKRAAALQPGRSDCNGHFLETSLQIQLAVV